jgi:pyruvate carboxylase
MRGRKRVFLHFPQSNSSGGEWKLPAVALTRKPGRKELRGEQQGHQKRVPCEGMEHIVSHLLLIEVIRYRVQAAVVAMKPSREGHSRLLATRWGERRCLQRLARCEMPTAQSTEGGIVCSENWGGATYWEVATQMNAMCSTLQGCS